MFLSWKNPGKRGVGHRRRHLGRACKSVRGRVTKRGGEQLKKGAVEGEGLSLAPDRFSRASKMAPAMANSAFSGVYPR